MISEKQKPTCEKRRRRSKRRKKKEKLGEGATQKGGGLWGGIWLLLAAAVADGGQSLAYCHSLTGQITSEHFLTGQVQNP